MNSMGMTSQISTFLSAFDISIGFNNDTFKYEILKDSKKFTSKKKITEVADYIKKNAISWTIAYEDEKTIDNLNIRNSVHKAMHASVSKILKNYNDNNDNSKLEYSENCVSVTRLNVTYCINVTLLVGRDALIMTVL